MTTHDDLDLRSQFHALAERPAAERAAALDRLRERSPELAAELAELLGEVSALGLDAALDDEPPTDGAGDGARGDLPSSDHRIAGHRIGRHELLGELGRGAMGVVYEARQDGLQRSVALKLMRDEDDLRAHGVDPRRQRVLRERFLEEAATLGRLDHPGIVPIHELGTTDDGRVYFTMRRVEGEDFGRVIDRVRQGVAGWTLQRALEALLKVCDSLAFAHDQGVHHRDLKPSHVLVGAYGETYVVDWGLARVVGRPGQRDIRLSDDAGGGTTDASRLMTMDGDVIGTPAYMPPEQARGELARMGPRSDIYSLGATLYHLLTGLPPYADRDARTGHDVLSCVREGAPTPVHQLAPAAPVELTAICDMAMARRPEARYASMAEMADDLRAFLEQRVVRAYRTGPAAEFRKWCQRNRAVAVAATVLLSVFLVGCATVAVNESRRRSATETQLAEIMRLSDVAILQQLETVAAELPARADQLERLDIWLGEAEMLTARLPAHEAALEEMRAEASVGAQASGPHAGLTRLLAETSGEPGNLGAFATAEQQWQHDTLTRLVDDLQAFQGPGGTLPQVRVRREFARQLLERDVDPLEALHLLETGLTGPLVELGTDADWFARFFDRAHPERVVDGLQASAEDFSELRDGMTLVFPEGVHDLGNFMRSSSFVPADITLAGAGRDKTLLLLGDLSSSGLVERLSFRDCTLFTGNNYLFDLRREPAIVALDRVRLTGFDMGAGASTAFGTEGLILRVRDSIITGGYGRHPEHGTLFDVRTHALLARFESSRLSVINLGLHHIRDRATVVFDDCQLTDILDAPYNASPPPGVQFVGTEAGGAVGGPPGIPRRFDLDELFPGWEDAD